MSPGAVGLGDDALIGLNALGDALKAEIGDAMLIAEMPSTVMKPSMILVRNRRLERKLTLVFCFAGVLLNQPIPNPQKFSLHAKRAGHQPA